jgi:hypothetical protein
MSETFGNTPYTEQAWFTTPMETCKPTWMVPMESTLPGMEPIVTFSLPLVGADGKPIGIIGVDVIVEPFVADCAGDEAVSQLLLYVVG